MIAFSKMHGLGNDFMVIDLISQRASLKPKQIRALADRHTGIGFDQSAPRCGFSLPHL